MPTGVEEIIGLALGGVSLLAGFAGAVEGYHLLHQLVDSDNGLKDIAAEWHVQCILFTQWGESVRVDDGDECLLHQESALVRGAIAMVIAKVLSIQQKMVPKLEKYGIKAIKLPAMQGPSEDAFQRSKANILRQQTLLLETIKADQDSQNTLLSVQRDIISNPNSLIAILHRTKELQAIKPEDLVRQAVCLDPAQVSFERSSVSAGAFQLGTYEAQNGLPQSVFMEWKFIRAGDPFRNQLVERINALGALLSLANASEYRRPQCLGTYDDTRYEQESNGSRRIAFVYSLPTPNFAIPTSLWSLLQDGTKSKTRPPLGERFILAYRLASAVYMFHASNWLHKGLRADRIVFSSESDVTSPWITGFQYSRPAKDLSLEVRPVEDPALDIYNRTDVGTGWTKLKDIYSLGILLWEIGYWRPVYETKFKKMSRQQVQNSLLDDLKGASGDMWDGLVGKMYMDVVRCCLKGDFGVVSGQSEQEAKVLGTVFFQKVLRELEACKA
ncbi:hypothetical protein ACHAQD_012150 [Fusarium lateritium]